MKLTLTGRQMTVSRTDRDVITRKLERLDRLLGGHAVSAQCVLAQERQMTVCELTVHARDAHILHGVGRARTIGPAVGGAIDKVAQQGKRLVDRWKTRRRDPGKRSPGAIGGEPLVDGAVTAQRPPRVIRTSTGVVKPMSIDDAVLAIQDGERAFLVFRLATSDRVAVLFRRPDGNFGLVESEP